MYERVNCREVYKNLNDYKHLIPFIDEEEEEEKEETSFQNDDLVFDWPDENEENVFNDECSIFERADESGRIALTVLSIRRSAYLFSKLRSSGYVKFVNEGINFLLKNRSILEMNWCVSEIILLLPVAVFHFPSLLPPAHLVYGLLPTTHGNALLKSLLTSNLNLFQPISTLIAQIVSEIESIFFHVSKPTHIFSFKDVVAPSHHSHSQNISTQNVTSLPLQTVTQSSTMLTDKQTHSHSNAAFDTAFPIWKSAATFLFDFSCPPIPSSSSSPSPSPAAAAAAAFLPSSMNAAQIRSILLKTHSFPDLLLHITTEILHDEIEFLSSIVFHSSSSPFSSPSSSSSRKWLLEHMEASQTRSNESKNVQSDNSEPKTPESVPELHAVLNNFGFFKNVMNPSAHIRSNLLTNAKMVMKEKGWCVLLHSHLKLFTVLIRLGGLNPTLYELEFWFSALSNRSMDSTSFSRTYISSPSPSPSPSRTPYSPTPPSPSLSPFPPHHDHPKTLKLNDQTFLLAFSFLSLIPSLKYPSLRSLYQSTIYSLFSSATSLHNPKKGMHGNYFEHLKGMKHNVSAFHYSEEGTAMVIWVAMHLILKRFSKLADLVRGTVGVHLTVHNASLIELSDASTSSGGPLSDTASLFKSVVCLKQRHTIRGILNERKQLILPPQIFPLLESLLLILEGKYLERISMDIHTAIFHCFMHSSLPIHPGLVKAIQLFSESSVKVFSKARPALTSATSSAMQLPAGTLRTLNESSLLSLLQPACLSIHHEKNINDDDFAKATLASYHMLCHEHAFREVYGDKNVIGNEYTWWKKLLCTFPWMTFSKEMERRWESMDSILPHWMSLASIIVPSHFSTNAVNFNELDEYWTLDSGDPLSISLFNDYFFNVQENGKNDFFKSTSASRVKKLKNKLPPLLSSSFSSPSLLPSPPLSPLTASPLPRPNHPSLTFLSHCISNALTFPQPIIAALSSWKFPFLLTTNDKTNPDDKSQFRRGMHLKRERFLIRHLLPLLMHEECPLLLQSSFCDWFLSPSPSIRQKLSFSFIDSICSSSPSNEKQKEEEEERGEGERETVKKDRDEKKIGKDKNHIDVQMGKDNDNDVDMEDMSNNDNDNDVHIQGGEEEEGNEEEERDEEEEGDEEEDEEGDEEGGEEDALSLFAPLHSLSCNPILFRIPLLLDLLLNTILHQCMVSYNHTFKHTMDWNGSKSMSKEEMASGILLHHSAVCQILIEACSKKEDLNDGKFPGRFHECRIIICHFLHSLFHSNPLLLKLVQFQTYNLGSVEVCVNHIPAMEACLNFVHELLVQPYLFQQLFALTLISHLCLKYDDDKRALELAKLALSHVDSVQKTISGCEKFLCASAMPVSVCAIAFPQLREQASTILLSSLKIASFTPKAPRDPMLQASAMAAITHLQKSSPIEACFVNLIYDQIGGSETKPNRTLSFGFGFGLRLTRPIMMM